MTNTKWLSALLAGTALTVASTAAMADTSLITMTRNAAGEGVTFYISPTADMPASATEVTIEGELRGLLTSTKADGSDRDTDLGTRARVVVKGKTDTSVGTVGAYVRFNQSDFSTDDNYVDANKAYGYWEFSPGVTLTVGLGIRGVIAARFSLPALGGGHPQPVLRPAHSIGNAV